MPQLAWDPLEFLDILGVVPKESEYGLSFHYAVERSGLRLELSVWPLNPDVSIEIFSANQAQPLVRFNLLSCPAARVLADRQGRFIEFAGGKAFAGRYDATAAASYGFRLWVEPYIQIEPYAYPT